MIKLLLSSIILFLAIYPLAQIRKHIITENELYGIFLGNYIYYMHYILITAFILCLLHYIVLPLPKKAVLGIFAIVLITVGAMGYYNYRNPQITHTSISLDKKADIASLKIAFAGDFHLASFTNKYIFEDMVTKINAEQPDIILLGGDILQNSHTQIKDDYAAIFSKLKSKYGVYTILGNHEYYGNDVDENIEYIKSLGIEILRDEVLKIEGINFIARDDIRRDYMEGERKSLDALYKENAISLDEVIIVLDHNPKNIQDSVDNKADIQLSAHTHAGQFFPYNMLLKLVTPNAYGYKKIEGLHTVVTSGVGYGYWKIVGPWQMPYRFGTKSEINSITIDFKN